MSKRRKQFEKLLSLSNYELQYDDKNLFDDEYGDSQRSESLIYEEIDVLRNRTLSDCLKIGRNLLELLRGDITCAKLDTIIERSELHFGRTQAIKYIECFNYYNAKFQKQQSTEKLDAMGIEKVYLLTTVNDPYKCEKLEQFILDENLTVKQLTALIKIINKKSETFKIAMKFLDELGEVDTTSKDRFNPF